MRKPALGWCLDLHRSAANILVSLSVTLFPGHVNAQWYVAPEYIYTKPDPSEFQGDDHSIGVSVGWIWDKRWSTDLAYSANKLIGKTPSSLIDQKSLTFNSQWGFGDPSRSRPFVSFGTGFMRLEANDDVDLTQVTTIGAGYTFKWPGIRSWDIQAEVRGRYAYNPEESAAGSDTLDGQALLRMRYGNPMPATQPKAGGVLVASDPRADRLEVASRRDGIQTARRPLNDDGDQDGVSNKRDRCPNTIRGVSVDVDGCMIGTR